MRGRGVFLPGSRAESFRPKGGSPTARGGRRTPRNQGLRGLGSQRSRREIDTKPRASQLLLQPAIRLAPAMPCNELEEECSLVRISHGILPPKGGSHAAREGRRAPKQPVAPRCQLSALSA